MWCFWNVLNCDMSCRHDVECRSCIVHYLILSFQWESSRAFNRNNRGLLEREGQMFNFNYDTAPISGVMIANTNRGLQSIANTNGVVMCFSLSKSLIYDVYDDLWAFTVRSGVVLCAQSHLQICCISLVNQNIRFWSELIPQMMVMPKFGCSPNSR